MKGTVKKSGIYFDNYPKKGSNNAVTSDGIARAIESGGGGGGGTGDYNDLTNKPKINGTTLQGNKSLSALGIASNEDLTALAGRVTQAESDIDTLETAMDSIKQVEFRIVNLNVGTQQNITAHSEYVLTSGEVTLNENEIPIGIFYVDGGYGSDAYKIVTKGFRINFDSTTRKASVTALIGNITDSDITVYCNASITVVKVS